MPTQAEIIKAIPPSLKTLGRGKTIRIMFQGGGDSAPPLELKDLIEKQTGLKLEIDVIPPENLHEKQLTFFTSGSSQYNRTRSKDPYFHKWAAWMDELLVLPFDKDEPSAFARMEEVWRFEV
jgi:hypothetical protein